MSYYLTSCPPNAGSVFDAISVSIEGDEAKAILGDRFALTDNPCNLGFPFNEMWFDFIYAGTDESGNILKIRKKGSPKAL